MPWPPKGGHFIFSLTGENRIKPLCTSEPHPGTFCAASGARFPPQRHAAAEPAEKRAQAVVHQVVQIEQAQMRHQLSQLNPKREQQSKELLKAFAESDLFYSFPFPEMYCTRPCSRSKYLVSHVAKMTWFRSER